LANDNRPYIDKISPIIVSLASPDQIILFGSYARGDNTDKSDIDLLIIKRNLKNGLNIIDSIYMASLKRAMELLSAFNLGDNGVLA
jgi:predicted nucleotidyltransferase